MRTVTHFTIITEQLATVGLRTINCIYEFFSASFTHLIELCLAFADKTSFNYHVGGDPWKPYIGDLEIGLWLFSFTDDKSLPELEHVTSAKQKERRHSARVYKIVRHLQDKLSRFPGQDNPSETESFEQNLHQEAQKLFAEPNGKELLLLLGDIYMSEAKAHLGKSAILGKFSILFSGFRFPKT